MPAGRLRPIPSGSYRGYTLDLIRPRCGAARGSSRATVTVEFGEDEVTVPVEDETQVTGRWADERCAELAIDRIAPLTWTGHRGPGDRQRRDRPVPADRDPDRPGRLVHGDTATGTPLFTSADGDFWTSARTSRAPADPVTMALRAKPARCDIHAFGSATGGTTFFVNVTIDAGSQKGQAQIRLAMSPELTNQAFAYAGEVCGF